MKQINLPALFTAITVVLMFSLVGVMMTYQSYLWMAVFFILGFIIMGIGIVIKVKNKPKSNE